MSKRTNFYLGMTFGLLISSLIWINALTVLEIRVTIENPEDHSTELYKYPHELEA